MTELREGLAGRASRAVCEAEGKHWMGLDNSCADVTRWFETGRAIADAILSELSDMGMVVVPRDEGAWTSTSATATTPPDENFYVNTIAMIAPSPNGRGRVSGPSLALPAIP